MGSEFQFDVRLEFTPESASEMLRSVPAVPGVFALRGQDASAEPYLTRAADLRRRMRRLLDPPDSQSRRLNLRERVHSIEYSVTGSEFESLLTLYEATATAFGAGEARRRLRLYPPYFLRLTLDHAHPRVYTTNRLSGRNLERTYGPFASRSAAERYCDGVLDLFRLRRCHEELEVHAEHPGCAYGEMKKCMAPCNLGCSAQDYESEARAVEAFLTTQGESLLATIAAERDRASSEMDFEAAAAAHERYAKVKLVAALADELVRPVERLRAVIVQEAADGEERQEAAVFLLHGGRLAGPARLSTLGVRAVRQQTSVGSSLFAQPLMLAPVPLTPATPEQDSAGDADESPESRAEKVLQALAVRSASQDRAADLQRMADHLSLLRRWYYRPEKQRAGEVFLPTADGSWPVRRILRGAARMTLGAPAPMAETDRAGLDAAMTKVLHEGREGVERVVLVSGRGRRKKNPAVVPADDQGKDIVFNG